MGEEKYGAVYGLDTVSQSYCIFSWPSDKATAIYLPREHWERIGAPLHVLVNVEPFGDIRG